MPTLSRTINHKPAFTLIEVLVVIAIIATISAIGVNQFQNAEEKARDKLRKDDISKIKQALVLAKQDEGFYKEDQDQLDNLVPTYIDRIPDDPRIQDAWIGSGYIYNPTTSTGTSCTNNCTKFQLTACLENANDPDRDLIMNSDCANVNIYIANASYTITSPQ